jgi:hypothetical protein
MERPPLTRRRQQPAQGLGVAPRHRRRPRFDGDRKVETETCMTTACTGTTHPFVLSPSKDCPSLPIAETKARLRQAQPERRRDNAEQRMAEMNKRFREDGGEIYLPAAE